MDRLLNIIRREVQRMTGMVAQPRIGIVDGYNPTNYCVRVRLQPGNQITGWLPILTMWGGNQWGMFCPPTPGDVVKVLFQEGGKEAGVVLGRFYSNKTRPLSVPAGEFWLVHQAGASIKLTNDGKVTATDKGGSVLVMNGDGTSTLTTNLKLVGNLEVTGTSKLDGAVTGNSSATFAGDVKGNGTSLHSHTHNVPNVQGGGATLPTNGPN